MISFFYDPSTRTRASFEIAMRSLGGEVIFSTENAGEFSSAKKGESLEHTIKVLNRYGPDVIILRYNRDLGSAMAAEISKAVIINAGDREPGQHPTQALLDLRTISKRLGRIDDISIAMVGDLIKGRTVRSLAYLLGKFKGITIHFISPKNAQMKSDVKKYLEKQNIYFFENTDLRKVARNVDVVYQTRTQEECGTEFNRKDNDGGYFIVDQEIASENSAPKADTPIAPKSITSKQVYPSKEDSFHSHKQGGAYSPGHWSQRGVSSFLGTD